MAITMTITNMMSLVPVVVLAEDDATQVVEVQTQGAQTENALTEGWNSYSSSDNVDVPQQETTPVAITTQPLDTNSNETQTTSNESATNTPTPTEEEIQDTVNESESETQDLDSFDANKQDTPTEEDQSEQTTDDKKIIDESKAKETTDNETEKEDEIAKTSGDVSNDLIKSDTKEETNTENGSDTAENSSYVPATYNIHQNSSKTMYTAYITKENVPNAYMAASMLKEKGFTNEAAAGIIGNLLYKSNKQGMTDINLTDNGKTIGIAQWADEKRKDFFAWCTSNNRQWDSMETQIDYLIDNMQFCWGCANQAESVEMLVENGLQNNLFLDYESFKSSNNLESTILSFFGIYENEVCAKTARKAGFSSLNEWIQYEYANRLKYASDVYIEFFEGTMLNIGYESEDLRLSYKKVEKDGFIVKKDNAQVYTDTNKTMVAGTVPKYGIVYKLSDTDKDGWYYVESGNVRGFIESKDLYSDKKSKALIEKLSGYVFKEADNEIALKDNDALDYTETTVYWFRNPGAEEFINYASKKAEDANDNATWISNTCSFFNLSEDLSQTFDRIGKKVEEIKDGNVVLYKSSEGFNAFAIAQSDGSLLTVNNEGKKILIDNIENIDILEARDLFDDTTSVERINDVPYYCQTDFGDIKFNTGFVASDGCGITSFSMVASYFLNEEISPAQSAVWAMENGANTVTNWGSYKLLAQHYGITLEGQYNGPMWGGSTETIVNALKEGKIVIASMQGGYFNPSNQGHYIVYTGIDVEGHIYINDPASRERTTAGAYSQEDAFRECIQFWIFTR